MMATTMPTPNPNPVGFTDAALYFGTLGLLVLAFVTGGESMGRGWGDAATQLLALLVLLFAAIVLGRAGSEHCRLILLPLALFGPLVIAAQLVLGTTSTPWATERALYDWLPPAAAFLGCAALPASAQRQGLRLLIVLVAASLLLAILQMASPQESIFNPFPQWRPVFNGLFSNPNHQATALAIAAVLLLTWPARTHSQQDAHSVFPVAGRIGLALFFLVAIPFTGSRGMTLIATAMLLMLPLANGWMRRWIRSEGGVSSRVLGVVVVQIVGFALVIVSILGWMRVDRLEEARGALRDATASMAGQAMPFGSGVGSFVPWFEAYLPVGLLQQEYYNHAHNEYVQWWLEGGVLGLVWIALLFVGFWWTRPRGVSRAVGPQGVWVGSWLGVGCVLAHSFFDYPLRTPALATATAWLAAIAVTCTIRHRRLGAEQARPHRRDQTSTAWRDEAQN